MARKIAALLLSFVLLIAASGVALTRRGVQEMQSSDLAFHGGDLTRSLLHARAAALSYVPGSDHVRAAYDRIEAIARGSESQGDLLLSRRAWETLRVALEQTDYPGRPISVRMQQAERSLRRVDSALHRGASEP